MLNSLEDSEMNNKAQNLQLSLAQLAHHLHLPGPVDCVREVRQGEALDSRLAEPGCSGTSLNALTFMYKLLVSSSVWSSAVRPQNFNLNVYK